MQKIRSLFLKSFPRAIDYRLSAVCFGIAWRLAVLALPWQTRWYREVSLAGWPWEQGSWAVYASWLPLIAAVVSGAVSSGFCLFPATKSQNKKAMLSLWVAGFIVAVSFFRSRSYVASAQWLAEVVLLGSFVSTLYANRVPVRSLLPWFVASLVPQALLAYWQYALQRVDDIKWLGVAFQSPKQLGVSVIEFADLRYLRAYGGMPHPNIQGGWLAVGILAAWQGAWRATRKNEALAWSAAAAVLGGALVLTFSRTAYLALVVGLVASAAVFFIKRDRMGYNVQFGVLALLATLTFSGVLAYTQIEVLLARSDMRSRLEYKSVDARLESYAGGWRVLKANPLFGSGPNAELASLWSSVSKDGMKNANQPLESPHNALLLLLANFGLLGAGIFLWHAWFSRKILLRRWWLLPSPLILASFDHYLWSYWSGLALLSVVLALVIAPEAD